uniref:Predicted AAA-ATPase n=1 Tax=Candidatus Kentrum sp. FW TaxID=2126338 RepID=A0A450T1Z5_9GAMM|nr:MAG: Predicted AAA-ATPase [Candidatus Kentron sp. FW]VFJ62482.1 MAG: Predicted AAA-ATPase [Candidatus Kentron sp. FW]
MNTTPTREPRPFPKPPIGLSDFPRLIREGYAYVDKSLLIRSVLDSATQALLLPRPRRFGKTLNLSMPRAFLERGMPENADLFQALAIVFDGKQLQVRHHLFRGGSL